MPQTNGTINMDYIPITEMTNPTLFKLSSLLNSRKILLTEEGYYRDYRGIAQLAILRNFLENAINFSDPTREILKHWHNCYPKKANFKNLQLILGKIDRWDALDDIHDNLVEDAKNYIIRRRNLEARSAALTARILPISAAQPDVLTIHDAQLYRRNLPPQKYDAYLLFAECDALHAVDIKRRLKEDYNFKICDKDDLLPGSLFIHKILTKLIDERCNRLIVILTKEFRKSPENDFYINYAQAEQIRKGSIKLLTLIYDDDVEMPRTLKNIYHLNASSNFFWDRLVISINVKAMMTANTINQLSSNNTRKKTMSSLLKRIFRRRQMILETTV